MELITHSILESYLLILRENYKQLQPDRGKMYFLLFSILGQILFFF